MVNLRNMLVPPFAGTPKDVLALAYAPKPLVVLLAANPMLANDGLVIVFEGIARDYYGRIEIYWAATSQNDAFRRVFPEARLPCILVASSDKELGAFSCPDSEPCIRQVLDGALNGNSGNFAVRDLQHIAFA